MSLQRDNFEAELAKPKPDWEKAEDWLSALAMFEMLPTLYGLSDARLQEVDEQAGKVFGGRGWLGAAQRIQWAIKVVQTRTIPAKPADLPADQVQDARDFLQATELPGLLASGRISFLGPGGRSLFEQAVNGDNVGGKVATHSPELQNLLVTLARKGALKLIRTFAPKNGPHGEPHGNKWICRAVDIAEYAGGRFHYTVEREKLITGVERLLGDLPSDVQFDMGFVRPVGGPTGYDTSKDVFFRVTQDRVAAAYEPDGSWGWGAMLEPPKSRIIASLHGTKVNYVFPDGADHMHVKALAAKP